MTARDALAAILDRKAHSDSDRYGVSRKPWVMLNLPMYLYDAAKAALRRETTTDQATGETT